MQSIVDGVTRFQNHIYPQKKDLFNSLAAGQNPQALFITCGDSRIVPDLIMQTSPGEIFICRNAGNIVPPMSDSSGGVAATIEYAVVALDVSNIILCGHSQCGAMKALLDPASLDGMPTVAPWLHHADSALRVVRENYPDLPEQDRLEILTKENVLTQLEHLKTHPAVAARLARGAINLYGWYYDIQTGGIQSFDYESGDFETLTATARIASATPPPRSLRTTKATDALAFESSPQAVSSE